MGNLGGTTRFLGGNDGKVHDKWWISVGLPERNGDLIAKKTKSIAKAWKAQKLTW